MGSAAETKGLEPKAVRETRAEEPRWLCANASRQDFLRVVARRIRSLSRILFSIQPCRWPTNSQGIVRIAYSVEGLEATQANLEDAVEAACKEWSSIDSQGRLKIEKAAALAETPELLFLWVDPISDPRRETLGLENLVKPAAGAGPPPSCGSGQTKWIGKVLFSKQITWSSESTQIMALHELGHTLGLDGKSCPVMCESTYSSQRPQKLDLKDANSMRKLYGF